MSQRRGNSLVITGMSGDGKTTIAEAVVSRLPGVARMITTTSRAMRDGEADGVHYHFKTREAFLAGVAADKFLEYEDNYGKLYGSSAEVLKAMRLQYDWVVAVIDPKGARTYLEKVPGCLVVFLSAPDDQLRERLRTRPNISETELESRLGKIPEERLLANLFDHRIVNDNDNFDATMTSLYRIMGDHTRRHE